MKRRSMLMRLLGLFGFVTPGLNSINSLFASKTDDLAAGGMIVPLEFNKLLDESWRTGNPIIAERPFKIDFSGRFVERIEEGRGVQMIRWDATKPGDLVLITDRNELGCPYRQEAFVAKSAPDMTKPEQPIELDPIPLQDFWDIAKITDDCRRTTVGLNWWSHAVVVPLDGTHVSADGKFSFHNSWE